MASEDLILKTIVQGASKASSELGKIDGSFSSITKKAIKASAAMAAVIGVAAVKQAAAFEKSMANISTLISGDSTKAIKELEVGIKSMMGELPVSADDLGASAYDIVSANITETSKALNVLEQSARLSVAGLGSAKEATDLMTSSINAFGLNADESDKIANILFKTVKYGKNTVSELAQSFGDVAPLAHTVGVSLEELSAGTAAITLTGKSASEAQTGLAATMTALLKTTPQLDDVYKRLNVSGGEDLIKSSGGLMEALKKVEKAGGELGYSLEELYGRKEALVTVMSLLGEQGDEYVNTLEDMEGGSDALTEATQKQLETFSANAAILKNEVNIALMELGNKVLPTVTDAVKSLNNMFEFNRTEQELGQIELVKSKRILADYRKAIDNTSGSHKEYFEKLEKIVEKEVLFNDLRADGHHFMAMTMVDDILEMKEELKEWTKENEGSLSTMGTDFQMFSVDATGYMSDFTSETARQLYIVSEKMRESGSHALQNFIDGLGENIPALDTQVGKVIGIVKRLQFSTNAEMPTELWGQHAIENFAQGISNSQSTLDVTIGSVVDSMLEIDKAQKDMVKAGIEGIQDLARSYERELGDVQKQVDELSKSLIDIFGEFADTESKERREVAEAIVDSENKVAELKKEITEEEDSSRRLLLSQQLEQEQSARDELKERIKNFEKEITEVKRVNGLTQLQLAFENFDKEMEKARELRDFKLESFDKELASAGVSWEKLKELHNERTEEIKKLLGEEYDANEDLQLKVGEAWQQVRNLIVELNNLKKARESMSFSSGGIVPEYANGGVVQHFASGGAAIGTDTVPAMLTPGEVILNKAQQKNLAGSFGGTINISGVFGTGAAEEIWDMLSEKLKLSSAI